MSTTAPQAPEQRSPARRLAGPAAGLLAVGVAWAGVALVRPGDAGPTFCPWRAITGLDCPFCGSTRSAAALAHGDLALALDHNAYFVLVVLPLAAIAWLVWALRSAQDRATPTLSTRVLITLVALTAAWWVLRLAVPWLGSGAS
jgi:hypothetical protein